MKFSLGHAVSFCRVATAAAAIVSTGGVVSVSAIGLASTSAQAAVVNRITVTGNRRVDAETIRSYLTITPGRSFSSFDTDESLRQLFATGLFRDVQIFQDGNALVVDVDEYPIVSRVIFEGNDKVKDEQLQAAVQLGDRAVLSEEVLASDRERVREVLRRSGRGQSEVTTEVVELGNNRVNVVFRIDEGGRTRIRDIRFIGNEAFGDGRLSEVVSLSETTILSFFTRDDVFDPDKLRTDEERLRRFYFNNGYADFQVLSAEAELDPETNRYTIVFTVEEGERYRFGDIAIDNTLSAVDDATLRRELTVRSGQIYSAEEIERSLKEMTEAISAQGYAFAQVTPRGERDPDSRTVGVTFFVDEGPRVYVDQIIIRGNTRTRDYVIRREFDLAEGDAYNKVLVDAARRRLLALGIFETVTIAPQRGSAPDRVDLVVNVQDKATGELSIGGGYSSESGALAEISFSERNFLGRGQFLRLSGGLGQDVTRYALSFTEPYFLGRRIAAGFDASYTINDEREGQPYEIETTIVRPRLSAALTDDLTASLFYEFNLEEVPDDFVVNPNQPAYLRALGIEGGFVTSSVGYSLIYSTLDSIQNPREGIYARLDQQYAGVGGDADFLRTTGRVSGYLTASTRNDIVLFGQVGAGHVEGFNDGLRLTDQFFRGGDIVRGFEPAGIGPRDVVRDITLGGTTYFNATAEVTFPMPVLPRSYGLRGALFADAATLYGTDLSTGVRDLSPESIATLNDEQIRASVGASVLWDSPFGPLRADIAYPIAKADYDKEQFFRFGVTTKF